MTADISHHDLMHRVRRETVRWLLLVTLNVTRPESASITLIKPVLQASYADTTADEIRRELAYLESRELIHITRDSLGGWACKLTRAGVDVVEYTVPCEPGIARPSRD